LGWLHVKNILGCVAGWQHIRSVPTGRPRPPRQRLVPSLDRGRQARPCASSDDAQARSRPSRRNHLDQMSAFHLQRRTARPNPSLDAIGDAI